jgi:hypothetical protein
MAIDQTYQVDLSVSIKPIWFNKPPTIRISLNGNIEDIVLEKETWFNYTYKSVSATNVLQIEFYGKTDKDSDMDNGKDTAIIIDQVKFNGISSPKIAWSGIYTPDYPLDYPASASTLSPCTYLGWNGTWILEFTVPVFTWIHQIEGLGWIYD